MIRFLRNLLTPAAVPAIDARAHHLAERAEKQRVEKRAYADRRVREIRQARAKFTGEVM